MEQEEVKSAIESRKDSLLCIFKDEFSTKKIFKHVQENLNNLIVTDDINLTYSNIREYAHFLTLDYLNNKSKEVATLNQ